MGELQQQGATSAEENRCLPINLPDYGCWAKHAFPFAGRPPSNERKLMFKIFPTDQHVLRLKPIHPDIAPSGPLHVGATHPPGFVAHPQHQDDPTVTSPGI